MTETFFFTHGALPLLISIPHDGRCLAPGMEERMTKAGRTLSDTDWHVRKLYEFAQVIGASVIAARFSRYVVDLNRPPSDRALYDGQLSTGLCPSKTFAGADIYKPGEEYDAFELNERVQIFWRPYHDRIEHELVRIRDRFGYALLWDAHSIRSQVPALFEGVLPDLNLGTNDGASCNQRLERAIFKAAQASGYSVALNGRFKGGFITRNYGDPTNGIHAVQLEVSQRTYMEECTFLYDDVRASRLIEAVRAFLEEFLASSRLV